MSTEKVVVVTGGASGMGLGICQRFAELGHTEVDKLTLLEPSPLMLGAGITTAEGEPLSYAPRHQLVLNANYRLPVDEVMGEMLATVSYIYHDEMQGVSQALSPYAKLPSYELLNANVNWSNVMGSPVDLSLFVTNLLNEKYRSYVVASTAAPVSSWTVSAYRACMERACDTTSKPALR